MSHKSTVIGRLGADAVLKTDKNQKSFVSFNLAVLKRQSKDPNAKEDATWISVLAYDPRFQGNLLQYLKQGTSLIIYGDYEDNLYKEQDVNGNITKCFINRTLRALDINFLPMSQKKEDANTAPTTNAPQQSVAAAPQVQPTTGMPNIPSPQANIPTDGDNDDLPF